MSSKISIVTVSYNSMAVLPTMLASVPSDTPVIIIDNSSKETKCLEELAYKTKSILRLNSKNKGFGEACNQGAEIAQTEFILFLNPDTILQEDTLINLEKAALKFPKALAMNPKIIKPNGASYFKRSSHLIKRSEWMKRGAPTTDKVVNILSGSAFFVRTKFFKEIGGWDSNIFMYHEEDDLCLRFQEIGGDLMFVPSSIIRHTRGASSPPSKEIAYLKGFHMGQSRIYSTKKYKISWARSKALFDSILQILSPINIISGRKRSKNWGYLNGILSSLITYSK